MIITDFVYDIEVYPNVFTCTFMSTEGKSRCYEISDRKNELGPLRSFVIKMEKVGSRMIGFNNINYDYPVLHYLLTELSDMAMEPGHICRKLYQKSQSIIEAPFNARFNHRVPRYEHIVQQIDLALIHHFDNQAKMTSLKVLEFNMRMGSIEELPFKPGSRLTPGQIEKLIEYNKHDARATLEFYRRSEAQVKFRESLSAKYNRDFMNHNDTKIGKDYFVMQLEQKLGLSACYTKEKGVRKVKQTVRESISLSDVIFPYVSFTTEPFRAVLDWLRGQTITETKGVFSGLTEAQMEGFRRYSPVKDKKKLNKQDRKLSVVLDGMEFVFGTGGIHASINNTRVESDIDHRTKEDIEKIELMKSIDCCNSTFDKVLSIVPPHLKGFANEYIQHIRRNPKASFTRR